MKNIDLLIQKIDEGIKYIQDQNTKLDPVLSYLTEQMIERKEELTAREIFDYYIRLEELKVNSLLVETKMKEILEYVE
jgi:hypothetical protein